jgi:hypothetical protein
VIRDEFEFDRKTYCGWGVMIDFLGYIDVM